MQYQVKNLVSDMKLLRNGALVVIKKGTQANVSLQEYQYLVKVYGMNVKGKKEIKIRVTTPAEIKPAETLEPIVHSVPKKRKSKKR